MYKKIILAIDFDQAGEWAAKRAKAFAQMSDAELEMVHVVESLPPYAYGILAGYSDFEHRIHQEATNSLAELAQKIDLPKEQTHLLEGDVKFEVLEFAKETNADLIITGSHGKHGLSLMLGSKANAILHGADIDVLIVREPNRK